jgi:hypothetical protein
MLHSCIFLLHNRNSGWYPSPTLPSLHCTSTCFLWCHSYARLQSTFTEQVNNQVRTTTPSQQEPLSLLLLPTLTRSSTPPDSPSPSLRTHGTSKFSLRVVPWYNRHQQPTLLREGRTRWERNGESTRSVEQLVVEGDGREMGGGGGRGG